MADRKQDDSALAWALLIVAVCLSFSGILLSIRCSILERRVDKLEQQVAVITTEGTHND